MNILITGGTGFIGRRLVQTINKNNKINNHKIHITGIASENCNHLDANLIDTSDLSKKFNWKPIIENMDAVVHLAGIAHRFESNSEREQNLYDQVNHIATRDLAHAIQENSKINKFIFVSTVRVHGDTPELPIRSSSPISPVTPYDKSKADAEIAVRQLLTESSDRLRWAIFRPTVVYGPGNRGNMARLEYLIDKKIPIPVTITPNRRSFLFIDNLIDAINHYLMHPNPPTAAEWIISDGQDISTEQLIIFMAKYRQGRANIWHIPDTVLKSTALAGDILNFLRIKFPWSSEIKNKLLADFYVDSSQIQNDLNWVPPYTPEIGIKITQESNP